MKRTIVDVFDKPDRAGAGEVRVKFGIPSMRRLQRQTPSGRRIVTPVPVSRTEYEVFRYRNAPEREELLRKYRVGAQF